MTKVCKFITSMSSDKQKTTKTKQNKNDCLKDGKQISLRISVYLGRAFDFRLQNAENMGNIDPDHL